MLRTVSIVLLLTVSRPLAAQQTDPADDQAKSGNADIPWVETVLKTWSHVCAKELKIEAKTLPWIIFYDDHAAWHLNPDEKFLPSHEKIREGIVFAGIHYPFIKVAHTTSIWVPDREPIPLSSGPTTTIPYERNRKTFFIAPFPSFFRKTAPADQAPSLDFLLLGLTIHELTHTRQLPFVLPQLVVIHDQGPRQSLNDNTVEAEFSQNEQYKRLYAEESKHLWSAVFEADERRSLAEIEKALALIDVRKREFFGGDNRGLEQADEIFLSLEGSAMWAQYRVMLSNAPHPNERELLSWLVRQGPAWSQERGLVLFLLIDRFAPDWKDRFFEKPVPPATPYLREVVAKRVKADQGR